MEDSDSESRGLEPDIQQHIKVLTTGDYINRAHSADVLEHMGQQAAQALVDELLKKQNPSAFADVTYVLEDMGKDAVDPISNALKKLVIKRPIDVYLLECLIDSLCRIDEKGCCRIIAQQIDKLNNTINTHPSTMLSRLCQDAKVNVHLALSRMSYAGKLYDLHKMLSEQSYLTRPEVIETLKNIGNKESLIFLIKAFKYNNSFSIEQLLKEAFKEISRRNSVEFKDSVFGRLDKQSRLILSKIYPRNRNGSHNNGKPMRYNLSHR